MEEHEANYAEKSKKISDAKSSNEKLTDSTNKSVDDIEKLEKISDSKECEVRIQRFLLFLFLIFMSRIFF